MLQTLLSYGLEIYSRDDEGNTLLTIAARFCRSATVTYISQRNSCDRQSWKKFSTHSYARRLWPYHRNHAPKWHDLDINSKIGLYGETPLAVAALFNKSEAVHYPLKEEADLSINTLLGANALHSAILGGSCVIIEKHTVTFSQNQVQRQSWFDTIVMFVAQYGNDEVVHSL